MSNFYGKRLECRDSNRRIRLPLARWRRLSEPAACVEDYRVPSMSISGDGYLWSVPAPARLAPAALPAIVDWCRSRRVERPMLVGGSWLSALPRGPALLHGLEAAGLAVWVFDRAASPTLAVVADAVAGYHFEGCDAVVAVGGGTATEIGKAAALLTGQRRPYRSLAPDPGIPAETVDASAVPPLLAVPATATAAAATCGALWIADEAGIARPFRHPALRPTEAILADDMVRAVPAAAAARAAAILALLAGDAGEAADGIAALAASGSAGGAVRAGFGLAAALEAAPSPRRRLALTAAAAGGVDFGRAMLALSNDAEWPAAVSGPIGPGILPDAALARLARSACGPTEAGAMDAVLAAAGITVTAAPRRRGRRERGG